VSGIIRDENGAVVSGATVTITNERTAEERAAKTDDSGVYTFTTLRPSFYSIRAQAPQFQAAEVPHFQLPAGQELKYDFSLKVATASTEVNVIDEAPLVDAGSARIGVNVNQREVEGLPINGRQLSQLYLQAPGSQNSGSGTFGDIRFSGRAVEQNEVRYDGIEGSGIIDAAPGVLNGEQASQFRLQSSLENVQEFRVESNNYPAEYGTGTGGQISVVTKSGSNSFHGSGFEYLRNDALDARNYFDLPGSKGKLRMNQFGGSLGGPIVKDRVFFFGSYEGYRLHTGINSVEAVPSASACSRAVPSVAQLCRDGFRGPGAVILPGKSVDPNFDIAQLQSNEVVSENSESLRLDFTLNNNWSLFTRYFRDNGRDIAPEGVTGRNIVIRAIPQNGVIGLTGVLTPNVVNELRFGYNGALTRLSAVAPTIDGINLLATTINISGSIANSGIAGQGSSSGIAVPGGLTRQNSAFNGRGAPYTPYSLSFIDSLSWIRGTHNFKLGGEARLVRLWTDRLGGTTYTYSNLDAFLNNVPQSVQYSGDLSAPSPFNNGATGERLAKQTYYIGYVQDEWHIRSGLTLNYGLRYEYYSPLTEDRNLDVLFDTNTGTLRPPSADFYHSQTTNFGPRVGLAWSPNQQGSGLFGGGRTILRAGFGIYYGPGQTEDQIQPIESDRVSTTISSNAPAFPADLNLLVNNFTSNPQNRAYQPRAYASDYSVPERIFQYTAGIQQELFPRTVLTASYVGMQGRNLFLRSVANQIVGVRTNPDPTKAAIVIRQFDIDNGGTNVLHPFAEIDYKTSGGHDSYNALQTSLVRRFETGLTLSAQYTYGRSYGNSDGSNEAKTSGNNAIAPAQFDYDNGYNNFDVRHNYNVSALYSVPVGRGHHALGNIGGITQALLGNWQIGSIISGRSGLPLDVNIVRPDTAYVDSAGNSFSTPAVGRTAVINTPGGGASRNVRRPDVIPGVDPYLHGAGLAMINPAAFAIPAPGTFGNYVRNTLRGPSFNQVDLTLGKQFPITETSNVEFRTEIFNLFNKANFGNPSVTLNDALGSGTNKLQPGQAYTGSAAGTTFGTLRSTVSRTVGIGTNRQIQFALRINF
jgi:hypothetical protein